LSRLDLNFDVPETFNMASVLVDRHVEEGRGERVAIHCGNFEERVQRA
jgi:acyl-coenzyme A synthetase/AMP-(fatty) acid ligase